MIPKILAKVHDICIMRILLASATPLEIQAGIELMPFQNDIRIERVITGVGLMAATFHLQKAIAAISPDLVIQAGVAGCFDQRQPLGSLIVVSEEMIGDLGVEEDGQFKDLFDLKLQTKDGKPFTEGRLVNPYLDHYDIQGWTPAKGISVSEITTRKDRIDYWLERYHPLVESMEGAALHYVCLMENIPFLQFRSLSNYIGERNKTRWQMGAAIQKLSEGLSDFLQSLDVPHKDKTK
jgi:futalosine hydrolase